MLNHNKIKMKRSEIYKVINIYRYELTAIFVMSAVANLMMLVPTLYMLQVFDRVMISKNEITLIVLTLIAVILYLVQGYCEHLRSKLVISMSLKIDKNLGNRIFNATFSNILTKQSIVPTQPFADLGTVRQWMGSQNIFAYFDLPWIFIYLAAMFMLHSILGWATIAFMIILVIFALWSNSSTQNFAKAIEDEDVQLNKFLYTRLKNAEVIESHGMTKYLRDEWWKNQKNNLIIKEKINHTQEIFTITSKQIRVLLQSLALALGAYLAIHGEISYGAMIAASLLMSRATSPIDQIVSGWQSLAKVVLSLKNLEEFIYIESNDIQEKNIIQDIKSMELLNICKKYNKKSNEILNNLNYKFELGTTYVLTGKSGIGKSTLIKIILKVEEYTNGSIYINNSNLREEYKNLILSKVGYLPQNIEIFNATVAENIAKMDNPDPMKVLKAAKLADIHDLILQLPNGYDTHLSSVIGVLSGGEKQRLALARALYDDPQLLILDEPNSHLDEKGELALKNSIIKMKENKSLIIIVTHKKNILEIADVILTIDNGKLIEV